MNFLWVVGGLAVVLLSGCTKTMSKETELDLSKCRAGYVAPNRAQLLSDLSAAEARWAKAAIRDYQYEAFSFAEPGFSAALRWTVRAGQAVSATPLNDRTTPPADLSQGVMEQRFNDVRTVVSDDRDASYCPFYTVNYDPADGHVTSYSSGFLSPYIADGGGGYTISAYTKQ